MRQVVNGETIYSVYGLQGDLLHRDNITTGDRVSYLRVGGMAIAEVTNAGVATYYHNDQLGSPVSSTDASGSILWREQYTPFGQSLQSDAAHADNIGFTGHIEDASGLTYMQARYYDPVVGRFLQTDPVGYDESQNLYAYVRNDPVNLSDPSGMRPPDEDMIEAHRSGGYIPPDASQYERFQRRQESLREQAVQDRQARREERAREAERRIDEAARALVGEETDPNRALAGTIGGELATAGIKDPITSGVRELVGSEGAEAIYDIAGPVVEATAEGGEARQRELTEGRRPLSELPSTIEDWYQHGGPETPRPR